MPHYRFTRIGEAVPGTPEAHLPLWVEAVAEKAPTPGNPIMAWVMTHFGQSDIEPDHANFHTSPVLEVLAEGIVRTQHAIWQCQHLPWRTQ